MTPPGDDAVLREYNVGVALDAGESFPRPDTVENQTFPSGPDVSSEGEALEGKDISVIFPEVSILAIKFAIESPNHTLLSDPNVIPDSDPACAVVGTGYSPINVPDVLMRPIMPTFVSLNHRFPSAPATISTGARFAANENS
jgi:hypothetical protein